MNRFLNWLFGTKDILYGFTALDCRMELAGVRAEYLRLLTKRGGCVYGSGEWQSLTLQLMQTLGRINDLERRYFGEPTK